jgi:starvation-inducible DNA-binding protein
MTGAVNTILAGTDLPRPAFAAISEAVNEVLADAFALYLKTKNFH